MKLRPFFVLGWYKNDESIELIKETTYWTFELAQEGRSHLLAADKSKGHDLRVFEVKATLSI